MFGDKRGKQFVQWPIEEVDKLVWQ